eukprot:115076-Pyramimonas_sp.AAC.1
MMRMKREAAEDNAAEDPGADVDRAMQDEPPEAGGQNGRWPADDLIYFLALRIRARPTLDEQIQNPTPSTSPWRRC